MNMARKKPKKEVKKKTLEEFKNTKLRDLNPDNTFVEDYKTWRDFTQNIGSGDLYVQNETTLYDFLTNHVLKPRKGSRNSAGGGANEVLTVINTFIDNDLLTVGNLEIIKGLEKVLVAMKNTGKSFNVEGDSEVLDPAHILFTETVDGEENYVTGHYATQTYADRYDVTPAPADFFAGENPPHLALFSEKPTKYCEPYGLLKIIQSLEIPEYGVEDEPLGGGDDAISEVEQYFDKIVREDKWWKGGRLVTTSLMKDIKTQTFRLNRKDEAYVRQRTKLGAKTANDALAGELRTITFTPTLEPILELVDNALKRKNTKKAPDGYMAWQNNRKRGFDYRKTALEAFGADSKRLARNRPKTGKGSRVNRGYSDNTKVISKRLWQQYLWR